MGASQSNPTEKNIALNNELLSKCQEFLGQNESRIWNGIVKLLNDKSISFSDEELHGVLCLLNLCLTHKDSLKAFENGLDCIDAIVSNDEKDVERNEGENVNSLPDVQSSTGNILSEEDFVTVDCDDKAEDSEPAIECTTEVDQEDTLISKEVSEDGYQFIILKSDDETHEEEKLKTLEKRKKLIRKKNGKLMAPLSSQSPRTCHASPSICLSIQN